MKPPCFLVKIPMKSQFFLVESHEIAIFNHHLVVRCRKIFSSGGVLPPNAPDQFLDGLEVGS